MSHRQQGRDAVALQGSDLNLTGPRAVLGSGLAGWLLRLWQHTAGRRMCAPKLALIERISLGPRQALILVEAEGMRVLVATSAEGGATFYPLRALLGYSRDRRASEASIRVARLGFRSGTRGRVSW